MPLNSETVFYLSNLIVLPFWLLMILLPRWRWANRIMSAFWPVALLSLIYVGLLLAMLIGGEGQLPDISLTGIAAGLSTPEGATVAWVHFLAFDLFVGRWAYLDSRQLGISPWLVSPTLFFVFMAGPLGLLLYLAVRWLNRTPAAASSGAR